jgi:hypothetical protein
MAKREPVCKIVFGGMEIPVSNLEAGKKALDGIFMIGGIVGVSESIGPRPKATVGKKRMAGSRERRAKRRQEKVKELFNKGMSPFAISKQLRAAYVTVRKDVKDLGLKKKEKVVSGKIRKGVKVDQ